MMMEQLEDRRVLAVVTSLADSGAGTLRDALAGPDATITFAVSGTINLTSGALNVGRSVSMDATGQSVTVNNTVGGNRVFNIDDGDGSANLNVSITNLTISGGSVSATGTGNAGGGIRNAELLTLTNSVITGNSAGVGGGVANVNGAQLTASNIDVRQNAAHYSGGGVSVSATSSASITGSQVRSNTVGTTNATTTSSFGGGLFNAGALTVANTTITENQSKHVNVATQTAFGGGVASTGTATTSISNSTISNNHADEIGGGLSGTAGATTHVLNNVTFTNNDAGFNAAAPTGVFGRGGGAYINGSMTGSVRNVPQVTITGGSFNSNKAQNAVVGVATSGSGGALFLGTNVEATIDGTSFISNETFNRGGAIAATNFGAGGGDAGAYSHIVIRNATITGNTASANVNPAGAAAFAYGGGIYQGVNVELELIDSAVRNSIIGTSNEGTAGNARGGGIFVGPFQGTEFPNRFSRIAINNTTIAGNEARDSSAFGAGIVFSQGGIGTIQNTTFENNFADGGSGGAIAVRSPTSSVTIEDSMIRNNQALDDPLASATLARSYGGGIASSSADTINLIRTQVINNSANWGGGVALRGTNTLIQDSVVSGNNATGHGGGVQIFRSANVVGNTLIENSTISNNSGGTVDLARTGGGIKSAIYAGSETGVVNITIRGTTIASNQSGLNGGAIEAVGASLAIENSTLANNRTGVPGTSTGEGGAIWFANTDGGLTGSLSIRFSTISGNVSETSGGGIWNSSANFSMSNSIAAGNTAATYYNDVLDQSYLDTITFSLVEDDAGSMAAFNPSNIVGVSANLGALGNNGGPTATMMPNVGSPARNAADPAATLQRDQRNYTRPGANNLRDMGAVEHDGEAATINGDFNGDGIYDCVDINMLTTAVANGGPVAPFDLNGDGILSILDMDAWRTEAGGVNLGPGRSYRPGDANLDGSVDGSDFGAWNAAKFTQNTNWCNGNFNGDLLVDGSDFGIWNGNKFTTSDANRPSPTRTASVSKSLVSDGKVEETQEHMFDGNDGAILVSGETWRDGDDGSLANRSAIQLPNVTHGSSVDLAIRHFALPTQEAVRVANLMPIQNAKSTTVASDRIMRAAAEEVARESVFEAFENASSLV